MSGPGFSTNGNCLGLCCRETAYPAEFWLAKHRRVLALYETARQDIAPDYKSGGQEFESLRARQLTQWLAQICPWSGKAGLTKG